MEQTPRMQWPYPTAEDDPWFDTYEDQLNAADASGYAHREDRHAILAEGGIITWDSGTGVLAWAGSIAVTSPITGFLWQVPTGNETIAEGETLYVVLNRGPGQNTNVATAVSSTVPSTDNAFALATRIGTRVYWRNGLKMENGDSLTNLGSGQGGGASTDLRTAPIIVGNTGAGDTTDNADYLDTGNGAQLSVALAAAAADTEVFVRPGTYDLGVVGSPTSPLTVPVGVRVRGAGKTSVVIRTKASADMGAFVVGTDAAIVDLGVEVSLPTGAGSGSVDVVLLNGDRALAERVRVTYLGSYGAPQAGNLAIRRSFGISNNIDDPMIMDPEVISAPSLRANGVGADLLGVTILGGTVDKGHMARIIRPVLDGGDWGIDVLNKALIVDPVINTPYMGGITVDAQGGSSEIRGGLVRNEAVVGVWIGVRLLNAVDRVMVSAIHVLSSGFPASSVGILVDNTVSQCRFLGANVFGLETGLSLTATTTKNVALLNVLASNSTPVLDVGILNDKAHNVTT